jgi:signal transduction histidine kinase
MIPVPSKLYTTKKCFKNGVVLALLSYFIVFLSYSQQTTRDSLSQALQELKEKMGTNTKDSVYIQLLSNLGAEMRFYQSDSLLKLSNEALKLSRAIDFKNGESSSLLNIAHYYSDKGNNAKAIKNFNEALRIVKQSKNKDLELRILSDLANEYGYIGDYGKALTSFLDCIEVAKKYGNKRILSVVHENIANLYASQKDFEEALLYFKEVKKINNEIGSELIKAETASNMASLYAEMGNFDYAIFNVNSSIATFEKHRIYDWLAYAYEIKGKTYLMQGKYEWAMFWYSQCEMLHTKIHDERGEIDLYNGMAEANLGLKKDSISEVYALKAFEISSRLMFKEGMQKCANTLYKIHKNQQDYATALEYHELYQKLTDTLSSNENKKSLAMLKNKVEYDTQKKDLIIKSEKALAQQKKYVYTALVILLIFLIVTFLVKRNEKIQRKLNIELKANKQSLEKSELELRDINKTKDKLFSIIGHDLRGPIGAFQGLLKLFKDGEINKDEFLGFIPKLSADIEHISFTLNNLLSWGQTQMNGATTKPSVISLDSLVADNIKLLSEIAVGKSIKMISQLSGNTMAWSDVNQIDIVIRNLISNALKFTPSNGMITIGATEKNDTWEVFVRDTGVGMPQEIIEKIFSENSTITTYGTNNEKGTGLGLSLCKEMVEKNKGTIWVDSMVRKGSCFYFTLPKAKKEYQKAS